MFLFANLPAPPCTRDGHTHTPWEAPPPNPGDLFCVSDTPPPPSMCIYWIFFWGGTCGSAVGGRGGGAPCLDRGRALPASKKARCLGTPCSTLFKATHPLPHKTLPNIWPWVIGRGVGERGRQGVVGTNTALLHCRGNEAGEQGRGWGWVCAGVATALVDSPTPFPYTFPPKP